MIKTHENRKISKRGWGERLRETANLRSEKEKLEQQYEKYKKRKADLEKVAGTSKGYCGGLTIEPEEYTDYKNKSFSHEFAGVVLKGNYNATEFSCKTLHKNYRTIREEGRQKIARYPPWESYIHVSVKVAIIIGSIIRIGTQNTHRPDLLRSLRRELIELSCIRYPKHIIRRALVKVRKKERWREIMQLLLDNLDRILK